MFRRRKTDWTPTIGISTVAITIYLVYTSIRLDKVIQQQNSDKVIQKREDQEAADDRQAIKDRSDKRDRQISIALTIMGLVITALAIKWANLIH